MTGVKILQNFQENNTAGVSLKSQVYNLQPM